MIDAEITYDPPGGFSHGMYRITFAGKPTKVVYRIHEDHMLWLDPNDPDQRAILLDIAKRSWNSCYPDEPV